MPTPESTREDQVERFWSKYLAKLKKRGIKPESHRWYVLRAEAFAEEWGLVFPLRKYGDTKLNC